MKNHLKKLSILLTTATFFFVTFYSIKESKAKSKKSSKELRINLTAEPLTLDPRKARCLNDINLIKLLNDGLVRLDQEEKYSLSLASSISISEDKKTYLIKLKEAFWTHGDPITSEDFIYSWKSSLSPNFPSDNASLLYVIKNGENIKKNRADSTLLGARAIDEKTLEIELEKPTPYFIDLLASPIFFPIPKKLDEQNSYQPQNIQKFTGSGPFTLSSWKHQHEILLEKNPKYWDADAVKLSKIQMVMVTPETGYNLFERDELDWEGSPFSLLPLDALSTLKQERKLLSQTFLISSFIRTNVDNKILKNQKIREALAYSIDREEIIEHVLNGNSYSASGLVPNSLKKGSSSSSIKSDHIDPSLLLTIGLEEENLSKKDLSNLSFCFLSSEKNYRIAQAIQQQWNKKLGVFVKIEPVEGKVFFTKISKKDYDLSLGSWVADFRDPVSFLEVFRTKEIGTNNTNWESREYLTALEKSYGAKDPKEREGYLDECEKILSTEMPIIPLFHGNMNYVKNEKLINVVLSDTGSIDFKWAFFLKD